MSLTTITKRIDLVIDTCCVCGVVHAIPEEMRANARRNGGSWYCPNGHYIGWDKKDSQTENDKLRGEVAELQGRIEREQMRTEAARRERAAIKGQLTKTKNRIAKGVCPCCSRSFTNVRRHMSTKHPEYAKEVV
jgi:hypothetical protein